MHFNVAIFWPFVAIHIKYIKRCRCAHYTLNRYNINTCVVFATAAQSANDYSASVSINILLDMDVDIVGMRFVLEMCTKMKMK